MTAVELVVIAVRAAPLTVVKEALERASLPKFHKKLSSRFIAKGNFT